MGRRWVQELAQNHSTPANSSSVKVKSSAWAYQTLFLGGGELYKGSRLSSPFLLALHISIYSMALIPASLEGYLMTHFPTLSSFRGWAPKQSARALTQLPLTHLTGCVTLSKPEISDTGFRHLLSGHDSNTKTHKAGGRIKWVNIATVLWTVPNM